jgi:CheY-like chemotaxis protein
MKIKALGTYDIARICLVTPTTVGRWIEEGKLPSFKTGGGHRRVWAKDLVVFLKEHNFPVPQDLEEGGRIKILIADDEEAVRKLLVKALKYIFPDAHVEEAADGYEVGYRMNNFLPDAVILDIRMPGIDGLKVCRLMRADEKLKRIKILAVSGLEARESREQALAAGADDFLPKPISQEALSKKLLALLPPNVRAA